MTTAMTSYSPSSSNAVSYTHLPAYLRTAQKQSHAEDCPLAQLYLSTNRAKTIMNSFNSEDRDYVSRQLHSLLTRISHVKPQKTSICKTNTNHATNFHIEKTPPQITQEGKHLQPKNLLMGFRDEDYNTPLLGYGKFSIEMENKDDRHTLLLKMCIRDSNKPVDSFKAHCVDGFSVCACGHVSLTGINILICP